MMSVNKLKLRPLTLGVQLLAGFGLLTASYFTTDNGWSNDFVKAAIHTQQPTSKVKIAVLSADLRC